MGSKINKLRVKHKLSQDELAFKIGVAQTSVSNFESDKTVPDFLIMHKICETFNVGFEYFLEEKVTNFNFKRVENNQNSNIGCAIESVHNHFPGGVLENMLRRIENLEKYNFEINKS